MILHIDSPLTTAMLLQLLSLSTNHFEDSENKSPSSCNRNDYPYQQRQKRHNMENPVFRIILVAVINSMLIELLDYMTPTTKESCILMRRVQHKMNTSFERFTVCCMTSTPIEYRPICCCVCNTHS